VLQYVKIIIKIIIIQDCYYLEMSRCKRTHPHLAPRLKKE
jgi:hypothetical protein